MSRLYSFAVLALFVALSAASHSRYGHVTWTKDPNDPLLVTFTRTEGWRYSAYGTQVGGMIYTGDLYYGDGTYSSNFQLKVTSVNTQDDWLLATGTQTHRFRNAGDFTVYFNGCCKVSNLNNNRDSNWFYSTQVRITAGEVAKTSPVNSSPVSGMLPIISIPYGVPNYQFQLVATDPEADAMVFSMATSAQLGDSSQTHPPGFTITSSGLVTLNTILSRGLWNTQQVITDAFGNYVTVDYILEVADAVKYCGGNCSNNAAIRCTSNSQCASCSSGQCVEALPRVVVDNLSSSASPRTNLAAPANGASITIPVNQVSVVSFVVDDANVNNPSTVPVISTSSIPSYGTASSQKDCTAANGCTYIGDFTKPQFIQVTLNPPTTAFGTAQVICIGAKSQGNSLPYSQHCVTVNINVPPPTQVCGNGAVEGSEECDGGDCCDANCKFASATTVCRAAADSCDVAEICSGSSVSCPADVRSASARCFCESQGVTEPKSHPDYFCVAGNSTQFYMCLYGAFLPQSSLMPCGPGTECGCPAGPECSCGGRQSPCGWPGVPQVC